MSEPKRIQRKRTKGWRMPEGAVYVGRPSRWGNPYAVKRVDCEGGGFCYTVAHRECFAPVVKHLDRPDQAQLAAAELYRRDLVNGRLDYGIGVVRAYLRGRDLSCWCPAAYACHADVLLEIANGGVA